MEYMHRDSFIVYQHNLVRPETTSLCLMGSLQDSARGSWYGAFMQIQSNTALRSTQNRLASPLCCLKNIALFSNLTTQEFAQFQNSAQLRTHKKGSIIFLEAEAAKFFYIVNSGWIKLFRTMPDGQEIIIDMLTTGQMFGENAIFEAEQHVCSAQVVEDVLLSSVPANLLREQIRRIPALALNMLSNMSKHHRRHYGELAFNAMLDAPQRVGCFLLRLCHGGSQDTVAFNLPYDKTLIADTLGMKGATFSRALNILRRESGVHIHDTRVEVGSVQQLAEFVYGVNSGIYAAENV